MTLLDCKPGETVRVAHSGQLVLVEVVNPCRVRIRPVGRQEPRTFVDAKGIEHTIAARWDARDVAPSVAVEPAA